MGFIIFARITAGEKEIYAGLSRKQIRGMVQDRMNQLIEREALFDEIIMEEL